MAGLLSGMSVVGAATRSPVLRDYNHAQRTFLSEGYALAPKLKFLFHVYFDINISAYNQGLATGNNFGLAVKTVKLPSYNFNAVELNQYNRKRIVQTKIKYNPVNFTLHDDSRNMITGLWSAYYTYYYKDGSNIGPVFNGPPPATPSATPPANYNARNLYESDISGDSNWGFIGESSPTASKKVPFFKNITIFGFNQHKFTAYTLINPIISSFSHDTYAYSANDGTMELNMDVDYETVAYNEGTMDGASPDSIVKGFGVRANYDRRTSPVPPKGFGGMPTAGYIPPAINGAE